MTANEVIYLFLLLIHLGNGIAILEMDTGYWTYERCKFFADKMTENTVTCIPKYIELGKVRVYDRY